MHPTLLQFGALEIRWYGVMIATACLIGYWLAGRILVEHFRADRLTYFGNLSTAQSIGIIGIFLGLILMIGLKSKRPITIK